MSKNANDRIKAAMRQRERDVLRHVRQCERDGEGYRPLLCPANWYSALDRLERAGKLRCAYGRNEQFYGWVRVGARLVRGRVQAPKKAGA